MDRIAVIIPCYNESKTVGKVIDDFKAALPEAVIYVYDNNSADGTDKIALEHGAQVRYEYRQGKGSVIRSMFRDVDSECYIMTDGDDTYPAEYAAKMAEEILDRGMDMVVGDRLSSTYFIENKRPFHNTGNRVVRGIINLLFKNNVRDIMTGYRAFSYEFVKTFPVLSRGFEIETEMTIHALDKNMNVSNVIINYRDRPEGSESKLSTGRDGIKVLLTIFNLYRNYRPMQFFNIFAAILMAAGIAFLIPVLHDYIRTGLVAKFPSLVASGIFALASLQSFFGGLILDNLIKSRRQNFEIKLNEIRQTYKSLRKAPRV